MENEGKAEGLFSWVRCQRGGSGRVRYWEEVHRHAG